VTVGIKRSSQSFFWRSITRGLAISACAFGAAMACSASGSSSGNPSTGLGASGGAGGSGATGATGGTINTGVGGTINTGTGGVLIDPGDASTGTGTCVRIGMLGRRPSYGSMPGVDNTDALQSWLNAHVKAGTSVDVVTTETELTADFLGRYDVIILQALEQQEGGPYWTFTTAELASLEAWVRAGGGIIAMTGYGAQSQEVNPTNQLLAFTGMSYNTDDVFGTCPDNCCYCAGSSIPLHGWHADHPIAANITAVGAFHGRTVSAGGGALVASEGSAVYGATMQVDSGRVFLYFDEWVAYSSQWSDTGSASLASMHPECADPTQTCGGRTPGASYQVPQFWYNALKWASGDAGCFDFTPDVPIVR
jgi:hypothetical protein